MATAVVTSKGQIVIPSKIRKELNITKGARLNVEQRGEELVLRPMTRAYFESLAGILGTRGRLTRALLQERALDKEREA